MAQIKKWLLRPAAALLGFIVVVVVIGVIAGIKIFQFRAMAEASASFVVPPEPVNVVEVRKEQWQPTLETVGTVTAVQGTVLSVEVAGVVREIMFEPGSVVEAGAELVRLDVEIEEAQLREAEAAAELAHLSYERAKRLFADRATSEAELETAAATMKQADAQVDNIRALIAKKVLRAPFSGRLGIRRISVGEFLDQGSPVVSLQSLDPIYVDFSLPQQRLGDLKEGLSVNVTPDSNSEDHIKGTITAIEPHVDPATRNVRIQATFDNADGRLRAGMFVSVEVLLARTDQVLVIPATAVLFEPHGASIFIVEEDQEAARESGLVLRQQSVRLGTRRGDFVAVTDGVTGGERVVATGAFKLRPGMQVVIDNTLLPEFSLTPQPAEG